MCCCVRVFWYNMMSLHLVTVKLFAHMVSNAHELQLLSKLYQLQMMSGFWYEYSLLCHLVNESLLWQLCQPALHVMLWVSLLWNLALYSPISQIWTTVSVMSFYMNEKKRCFPVPIFLALIDFLTLLSILKIYVIVYVAFLFLLYSVFYLFIILFLLSSKAET